jgi:hypothetical protein
MPRAFGRHVELLLPRRGVNPSVNQMTTADIRTPAQLKDSDREFFRHRFERADNGSYPTRPFLPSRAISRETPRVHFSDHTR